MGVGDDIAAPRCCCMPSNNQLSESTSSCRRQESLAGVLPGMTSWAVAVGSKKGSLLGQVSCRTRLDLRPTDTLQKRACHITEDDSARLHAQRAGHAGQNCAARLLCTLAGPDCRGICHRLDAAYEGVRQGIMLSGLYHQTMTSACRNGLATRSFCSMAAWCSTASGMELRPLCSWCCCWKGYSWVWWRPGSRLLAWCLLTR